MLECDRSIRLRIWILYPWSARGFPTNLSVVPGGSVTI